MNMPETDMFGHAEAAKRRLHDQLTALLESPEYGAALEVWREMMLESFEQWLNDTLMPQDAERLRQRAIGTHKAITAIDESLGPIRAWTEQLRAALQERTDTRALEQAMVDHANQERAMALAAQGE